MKPLEHKVYILQDADKKEVDLNDVQTLSIVINDKISELFIEDLFKKYEFENSKIVGYSYLQYYILKDGYLVDKDENKINFYLNSKQKQLFIKKVRNAVIMLPDIDAKDAYIRDVEKLIELAQKKQNPSVAKQIEDIREEQGIVTVETDEQPSAEVVIEEPEISEEEKAAAEAAEKEAIEKAKAEEEARIKAEEEAKAKAEEEARAKAEEEAKAKAEEEAKAKAEEEARIKAEEAKAKAEEEARIKAEAEAKAAAEEAARIEAAKKAAEEEARKAAEQEEEQVSYEDMRSFYVDNKGYKEFEKGKYRLLYKNEDDLVYLVKPTAKGFEQLYGEMIEDDSNKFVYQFEENGKVKKLTFSKKEESIEVA